MSSTRLPAKHEDGLRHKRAPRRTRTHLLAQKPPTNSRPAEEFSSAPSSELWEEDTCDRWRGKAEGEKKKKKRAAAENVADSTDAAPKPPNTSVIYEQTKNVCRETYFASLFFHSSYRASFVFFFLLFFFLFCEPCAKAVATRSSEWLLS